MGSTTQRPPLVSSAVPAAKLSPPTVGLGKTGYDVSMVALADNGALADEVEPTVLWPPVPEPWARTTGYVNR